MSRTGNNFEAGYTLLEVMVVLSILAMVTTVIPAIVRGASPALRLGKAVEETMNDLARIRARARLEGAPRSLVLGEGGKGYRIDSAGPGVVLADMVSITIESGDGSFRNSREYAVTFYPEGGGSGARITLSTGGVSEEIEVDWLTGSIRRVDPS